MKDIEGNIADSPSNDGDGYGDGYGRG